MIASYCLKKGKVVILLNTVHSDRGIELLETESKAEVITYFNSKLTTKGGVDTMDQMERWFTSKKNSGMALDNILQHGGHQLSKRFYNMDVPQQEKPCWEMWQRIEGEPTN